MPSASACLPIRTSWALLAGFLLAGCATQTSTRYDLPELGDWDSRTELLGRLDQWQLSGRVGIKTEDDGFNARFRHEQSSSRFDTTLSGPLGIGTLRMQGRGSRVTLTDKDGQQLTLSDVEPDLYRLYGWTIPVSSLRYWALGIPDPSLPGEPVLDAEGRLVSVEQRGWTVTVDRYRAFAGQQLPARITAQNPTTRVRLVVDNWSIFEQL